MRIAVVVATLGRPAEVSLLLDRLARQTLPPCAIILSVESQKDLPADLPPLVEVVMGPRGVCVQRNRGIDLVLHRSDLLAFFDDDFLPANSALAGMAALFTAHPDIAGATGHVLADGIKSFQRRNVIPHATPSQAQHGGQLPLRKNLRQAQHAAARLP